MKRAAWRATCVSLLSFAVLAATGPVRGSAKKEPALEIMPEYARLLKRMVITIPVINEGQRSANNIPSAAREVLEGAYSDLLAVLPAYTVLEIVVRKKDQPAVQAWIDEIARTHPVSLHVMSSSVEPDFWAQDLGEPFHDEGADGFLVSMDLSPALSYDNRVTPSRYRIAEDIVGRQSVHRARFAFEGGNLLFDRSPSGIRALIGYNDIVLTQQNYSADGRDLSFEQVVKLIAKELSGAEVVVMGQEVQSRHMPHIDQSFILLAGGIAVVNEITDRRSKAKERVHLRYFRLQLEALGYRIIAIDNTAAEIERGYTSTNAIPFVDAQTGKKTIIYPVFPGEVKAGAGRPLAKSDLSGKGWKAYEVYEAAGYLPVPFRDFTHTAGGSAHCIVNVLE